MSTRWMAAFGVGVLTVLASACSSGGPSSTTTTTSTTTTSNPDTTVPGLPTTSTTATPAGTALCAGPNVGVSGKMASSAAGHQGVVLLFVNNGSTSCVLYGYPGRPASTRAGPRWSRRNAP